MRVQQKFGEPAELILMVPQMSSAMSEPIAVCWPLRFSNMPATR